VGGFAFLVNAHLNILISDRWYRQFLRRRPSLVNCLLTSQFVFDRVATARGFALLFAALIGLSAMFPAKLASLS
jgi:hypothetical protein